MCQFSVKTDNFESFGLTLGKSPNYMRYSGSNNVEDVAESLMEAEMSWVEVGGGELRWMELGGAVWRWVHGLAIPKKKLITNFFLLAQFNYYPLIWMIHSPFNNSRGKYLHETCLRLIYSNQTSLYEELLDIKESVSIQIMYWAPNI